MVEFVSVDHSVADQGDRYFLVGVAIEVDNGSEFDRYYFDLVNQFCDRYNIELAHDIIKSRDVLNRVASYDISKASEAVAKGVAQNPAIRRIHICIGWYPKNVEFRWKEKETPGIEFASNILNNYFPIVTLWRYHRSHRHHGNIPSEAWVDNIQGKITKAWKYVGNEFEVNLVPHGDTTYPSLSTADIIAGHLARTLPHDKPLSELEDSAAGQLIKYTDIDGHNTGYVEAESVNETHEDHIVPSYPYSIQGELHFPHPVIFLYDEVFEETHGNVLPETDFHAFARKWAWENAGCVINMQPHRLPSIVRSGDRIVYTSDHRPEVCNKLDELNPTKDIKIMDSSQLVDEMME